MGKRSAVLGWPEGRFVPGMLRDGDLLHDAGGAHDAFEYDAYVIRAPKPTPRRQNKKTARQLEKKRERVSKENRRTRCFAEGCEEKIDPKSRNDARKPLCEKHKRAFPVACEDCSVVSFCFYCNRTHDTAVFTIKKNVCDKRYLERRNRILGHASTLGSVL